MAAGGAELHGARPAAAGWPRQLTTPLVVAGLGLALAGWLSVQELDSIEQRQLTGEVLMSKVAEHLRLSFASTAIVVALAVSLGIALTRPRLGRLAPLVITVANVGQAVPSVGVLVLIAIVAGVGFDKAVLALVAYSLLPVLRNTMVGLRGVDPALIEAARGMGMSTWATLRRIELPLAVPVILAGIRTALAINVGSATLATFIDGGGLGDTITSGIRLGRDTVLVAGAGLTALIALSLDWLAGLVEDVLRPRGMG